VCQLYKVIEPCKFTFFPVKESESSKCKIKAIGNWWVYREIHKRNECKYNVTKKRNECKYNVTKKERDLL
jgi:hypothetical protein